MPELDEFANEGEPYEMARAMARVILMQRQQERSSLTQDDLRKVVEHVCNTPITNLPQDNREKLVSALEVEFETVIGVARELVGEDEGWTRWMPARKAAVEWRYWHRYRKHLERDEGFSHNVLRELERSTDSVLGFLGDPQLLTGVWDRRGLVVGLVQSGKTAHYIGVINKAVDAGYQFIVVMTGFTENLRKQTQARVENGILGYSMRMDESGDGVTRSVGVSLHGKVTSRVQSKTTLDVDFNKTTQKVLGGNFSYDSPEIFVIKKNIHALNSILKYVENRTQRTDAEGRSFVDGFPLLVIDDESDVGSIDTKAGVLDGSGAPEEEHDPTKINKLIRKLLTLFDQKSYIGYTATPFANVLIHDQGQSGPDPEDGRIIGPDLFPRSFIVSLEPPSTHVGPEEMFGTGDDLNAEGLPIIRHVKDSEKGDTREDYWIPASHRKTHVPRYESRDEVPPSLRKAILSFILACSARALRGDRSKDSSMLVHVTRFKDVQECVAAQVDKALDDVQQRLQNNVAIETLLEEFRKLWNEDFVPTTKSIRGRDGSMYENPTHAWPEVQGGLREAALSIEVRVIHGTSGVDLDYGNHPEGLKVIAIGGDKLSRGLTLSGLCVSYFLRCSKMYDTLMQMGRWFGYRPGYLDLCRLYTTKEMSEWFRHIAVATHELRAEFKLMANLGSTPLQFGLKVLSHDAMQVTSSVKMRHGTQMKVSFAGSAPETIDFSRQSEDVKRNWNAGEVLIKGLETKLRVTEAPPRENRVLWSGVATASVLGFLDMYEEHPAAKSVKTQRLKQYIEGENQKGRLIRWDVLVAGGEKQMTNLGEAHVKLVGREWYPLGGISKKSELEEWKKGVEELKKANHYRIKAISSPDHEKVGLSTQQHKEALAITVADWRKSGALGEDKQPKSPNKHSLRLVRSEEEGGLLILHPLDPGEEHAESTETPILAFVIVFPRVSGGTETKVKYIANNSWMVQDARQADLDFSQ